MLTSPKKELRGRSPRANYTDRRFSAKLMPNFEGRGCHVVYAADPYGRILGFLDWSDYFFFQAAPQLYPLLFTKSSRAGNRTRTCGSVVRNSDH
jgi:hypothetical protein